MERLAIRSSNLRSVGFERNRTGQAGILEVEFHNGAVYQYRDVPLQLANDLMRAPSAGRFFREQIEPFARRDYIKKEFVSTPRRNS